MPNDELPDLTDEERALMARGWSRYNIQVMRSAEALGLPYDIVVGHEGPGEVSLMEQVALNRAREAAARGDADAAK